MPRNRPEEKHKVEDGGWGLEVRDGGKLVIVVGTGELGLASAADIACTIQVTHTVCVNDVIR